MGFFSNDKDDQQAQGPQPFQDPAVPSQPSNDYDPQASQPPMQQSIDGVMPTTGGMQSPTMPATPAAHYGDTVATAPVDDSGTGYIMTAPDVPETPPTNPSPAFNPNVGAPSSYVPQQPSAPEQLAPELISAAPEQPMTEQPVAPAEIMQEQIMPEQTHTIEAAYPGMDAPQEQPLEPAGEPINVTVAPPVTTPLQDLSLIKQQALLQLSPLVNHLDQKPEDRFNTTMMMLQATDDQTLVPVAYEAAQAITDERLKAQALLDIVNEINYFSNNKNTTV